VAVHESARVRPDVVVESTTAATTRAPVHLHRIEITARTFFTLLLVLATCWALLKLTPVILMIVASLMLVGALNPVVERLEARGWRRGFAISVVFTVLVLVTAILITLTFPALLAQGAALMERNRLCASNWRSGSRSGASPRRSPSRSVGSTTGRCLATRQRSH